MEGELGDSKRPLEELIRRTAAAQSAMRKNSILQMDIKPGEANSSVSITGESARCLFWQELGMGARRCNSTFKGAMDAEGALRRGGIRSMFRNTNRLTMHCMGVANPRSLHSRQEIATWTGPPLYIHPGNFAKRTT